MKYFAELGQNKELSIAELQAVYPDIKILSRTDKAAVFKYDGKIDIERLGGIPKLGEIVGEGEAKEVILRELKKFPKDKKIFFGFSFYGKADKDLGKKIKKELKNEGYKVRWVTGKEPVLSSVIVRTNKLLTRGGEFCIIPRHSREGGNLIARTISAQNFSDYEFRDINRPARDLKSGMTPPKLAKILINLGLFSSPYQGEVRRGSEILDPFCGSGTFLMEAALQGIKNIYGSDISQKAVKDSKENIKWFQEKYKNSAKIQIKKCDVKNLSKCWQKKFGLIVCEPYLGPPVRGELNKNQAQNLKKELQKNYEEYLFGLSEVLEKGGRLVLIVPFIISPSASNSPSGRGRTRDLFLDLDIKKHGFKAVHEPISYSRPNQKIGRQIYILEKFKNNKQ